MVVATAPSASGCRRFRRGIGKAIVWWSTQISFSEKGTAFQIPTDEKLHLIERFTRRDADTLIYEFTVEDPTVQTKAWTASVPDDSGLTNRCSNTPAMKEITECWEFYGAHGPKTKRRRKRRKTSGSELPQAGEHAGRAARGIRNQRGA